MKTGNTGKLPAIVNRNIRIGLGGKLITPVRKKKDGSRNEIYDIDMITAKTACSLSVDSDGKLPGLYEEPAVEIYEDEDYHKLTFSPQKNDC